MPLGSSSDAPVISPGPRIASHPFFPGAPGVGRRAVRPASKGCLVGWCRCRASSRVMIARLPDANPDVAVPKRGFKRTARSIGWGAGQWLEQQGPGLGMTRLGQPSRDVHRRAMHDTADSVAAWQPVGLMFSSSPTTPAGRLTVLLMPSNDALSVTTRPPASGDPLICPPARPILRRKCRSRLTGRRRGRTSASDSTTWLQGSTRLAPCAIRAAGTGGTPTPI